MTDITHFDISELVPHSERMCLLDRALTADADSLSAEVEIRSDSLFHHQGQVGAWVGIEYMAQAIAAWAGWQARQRGAAPQVGFLLGCRRYSSQRSSFSVGERLQIKVQRQFQADNGLGQFDCCIESNGEQLAAARLTVFEPADAAAFLQETSHD